MQFTNKDLERYWNKVGKTEDCWLWTANKFKGGYGQYQFLGKPNGAHRISWIIHYGEIPKGMHVLHRCDNPPCVNPNHLFLGTHTDNMKDKAEKGRSRTNNKKGSSN